VTISTVNELPHPTDIRLKQRSRRLVIRFSDGREFALPAEYLRVHSPSAEVKGHAGGEGVLVTGKERVNIERIEPVGRYAIKLVFDDGHNTGLYNWATLYELGVEQDAKWSRYLARLAAAGVARTESESP
jgi:DUF971 family protein